MKLPKQIDLRDVEPGVRPTLIVALVDQIVEKWKEIFLEEDGISYSKGNIPVLENSKKVANGRKCAMVHGVLWGFELGLSPIDESYEDVKVHFRHHCRSMQVAMVFSCILGAIALIGAGFYCYTNYPIQISDGSVLTEKGCALYSILFAMTVFAASIGIMTLVIKGIAYYTLDREEQAGDKAAAIEVILQCLAVKDELALLTQSAVVAKKPKRAAAPTKKSKAT